MSANFNQLVDHFGFANANRVLIQSDDGKTCNVTQVVHYGPIDAEEISSPVYNPVCVYEVVGTTTVNIVLGDKAPNLNAIITSVEIKTVPGESAKITIRGTANEGARAINRFTFSCGVTPRHRVQNLLNATTSIVNATSVTAVAKVDPVVVWEAGAPCASDVVSGVVSVSVDFYGTAPAAATGWTKVEDPTGCQGNDYKRNRVNFIKKLSLAA